MNCLIVYAHPEEKSFNAAMRDLALSSFVELGYEVKVSDLYKLRFKAPADKDDFQELSRPERLNYILEEKNASDLGFFVNDIKEEQKKVLWADLILFQFPVWWFSVPAILKGWFDRVLAAGFAWDFGKMYDRGLLVGKRSMVAVTTGGTENFYSPAGPHGVDIEQVLYGVNHGTLYFCGMDVLPMFVAYAVFQVAEEKRKEYLQEYKRRLMSLSSAEPVKYHKFSDYDQDFRLKR